ncbi:MAG: hypothetical protein R3A48_21145 [Polyangiales bacterium]
MSSPPPARVEFPEARVLPQRLRLPAALGLSLLMLLFALLPIATLGTSGALLCLAALVPLLVQRHWSRRGGSRVSVARHRLFVHGREALRRSELSFVYLTTGPDGATVHFLRGAESPLEVLLPDAHAARALLERMEVTPLPLARFRVDSPASSRLPPWLAWGFAGIVVISNAAGLQRVVSPAEVFALLMAWAAFAVFMGSVGAELAVGDDALVFRWFGRERVIPLARVAEVKPVVEGVRVNLVDGESLEFHVRFAPPRHAGSMSARESRAAWQREIIARIEAARERLSASDVQLSLPALADGDAEAWVDAVREAARSRDAHYREHALTEERLWQAVESPRTHGARRAAAAIALGASLDEPGRARMRIAAEGVATPRVRIALEAVARGDDEALLEAAQGLAEAERRAGD